MLDKKVNIGIYINFYVSQLKESNIKINYFHFQIFLLTIKPAKFYFWIEWVKAKKTLYLALHFRTIPFFGSLLMSVAMTLISDGKIVQNLWKQFVPFSPLHSRQWI